MNDAEQFKSPALIAPTAPATGYGRIVTRDMVWVLLHSGSPKA